MYLHLRILGLDLLALEVTTDSPCTEPDEDDYGRDLSGGTTASDIIDAGPTDHYMGFANGREEDG